MSRDKAAYDEPFTERPALVGHGFDIMEVSSKKWVVVSKKLRSKSLNKPN